MFSVLNNMSLLSARTGRILLYFLFFWLCSGCFLFLHVALIQSRIQQQRVEQVEDGLSRYLVKNLTAVDANRHMQAEIPRELDFIRLVKGREQLLLTRSTEMDFGGLVDVAPLAHGAWIDLFSPEKKGVWILVSRQLTDGSIIQGGFNDGSLGIAIYENFRQSCWYFFFATGFASMLLAWLLVCVMERPLRRLQDAILRGLDTQQFSFAAGDPATPLYTLLEKIFYQNRQLIGEMQASLDNVAHDLRTPMTRLRAGAEYALQSDTKDPQKYRAALSDCLEESERVLAMLRVMMSVAEAEAGTMRLELQEVDLQETLDDVMNLYQYVAEEEQITVSCDCSEKINIRADITRIRQVWANLLDNGIKYGKVAGTVRIRAVKKDAQAQVSFTDNGMGISGAELNRIWDRLYRGDRSRTKQGLGLGLNYVKAVVEAHGGTVLVTSTIREGSCFTVTLPLQS